MKLIRMIMMVVGTIVVIFPAITIAEAPPSRGRCWSRDIAMRPINDPQMRVTIVGRVVALNYNSRQQSGIGTQLRLKADRGQEMSVYLGPSRYIRSRNISLRIGDRVEIQGAKITGVRQSNTIVASTIKKGSQIWKVRDPNGKPTWAKWCR